MLRGRKVAHLDNDLLGMVEQVVLAHGRTFTGTWFSTFSAYACRLRGYYGRHPDDTCYVYAPDNKRFDFAQWKMPSHAFYPREWALAWEGIDFEPPRSASPTPPSEGQHGAWREGAQGGLLPHGAWLEGAQGLLPAARRYYPDFKPERMIYPDKAVAAKKQAQRQQAGRG